MRSGWSNNAPASHRRDYRSLAGILLISVCIAVSGCDSPDPYAEKSPNAPAAQGGEKGISAEEILRRSAKVYTGCKTYSDEGELQVKFPGSQEPSRFPFAVNFVRARQKVKIDAYQITLASDGKRMRGMVEDALSKNLDGQFLDVAAPSLLKPENVIADSEAAAILSQGAGGPPPVLDWLLSGAPFKEIVAAPERLKKLTAREIEGKSYYRVQVDLRGSLVPGNGEKEASEAAPASFIVLWIDQSSWLVRRLEYPHITDAAKGEPASESNITITAELHSAKVDAPLVDGLFVLEPTKEAKVVSFFVPPPPPIPLDRLGKAPARFEVEKLEGGKLSSDDLKGKTAVLLFARNHPACEEAARQLAEVYATLKNDPRFDFRVIANESWEVSNANIAGMLERWAVTIPAARDSGAVTNDSLGINALPTLIILDPRGRMQLSQSYGFGAMATTLPAVCEQIASGEDVFHRLLDGQKQYEERLAIAKSGGKPSAMQLSPTKIAPASSPRRLKLETAWDLTTQTPAACLIATTEGDGSKLLLLQSPRTAKWLSLAGKELGEVSLDAPDSTNLSVMRATRDAKGRLTLTAFTPGGEAAYFFDEQGKRLASFPPTGQPHEGVADALANDLDGKEGIEGYIGFSAFLGVQAIDLKGQRIWRNLAIPSVISLALGPPNPVGWRKLYATDDRGRIVMLNQFGKHEFVQLADREIHRLFYRTDANAAEATEKDAIFCGISFQAKDDLLAIGYDSEFNEAWTYKLPPGVFVGPVQYATSIAIPNTSDVLWLIAAPDGSIHFIGSKGQFEDSFCVGQRIVALTAAIHAGKPMVVYATETGIHARTIEMPAKE